MNRVLRIGFGSVLALLLATAAWAQATAQINGTVTDASGGVLPGVTVTAHPDRHRLPPRSRDRRTGAFTLTEPADRARTGSRWRWPASARYVQTGHRAARSAAIPSSTSRCALGELAETVSVEASAPLVETRNPAIGGVIENERIEELPLNGRNSGRPDRDRRRRGAGGRRPSSRSMQGGVGYSVAGGQPFGVAYLLDGAMHNNPYDNFNLPLPFPDALQEFRVETSAQNAQNGFHSGASVNVATKSGTNALSRRPVRVRPPPPLQRDQPVQRRRSRPPASGATTA